MLLVQHTAHRRRQPRAPECGKTPSPNTEPREGHSRGSLAWTLPPPPQRTAGGTLVGPDTVVVLSLPPSRCDSSHSSSKGRNAAVGPQQDSSRLLSLLRAAADREARKAGHLDVLAQLGGVALDELVDRHARVADVRLLEKQLGLDRLLHPPVDDLLDDLLGLPLQVVAGRLDLLLLLDPVRRDVVARDGLLSAPLPPLPEDSRPRLERRRSRRLDSRARGDLHGERLCELLERGGARSEAEGGGRGRGRVVPRVVPKASVTNNSLQQRNAIHSRWRHRRRR